MIFHDISRECYDWLKKQPNVKEESLTDWILYTVSERSSQFYYKAFSRNEEAYNGADWEWWILTGDYSNYTAYRFLVQAKKLKKDQDNYPLISYSNRNGLQIDLLIDSAKCRNAMPIYIYYSTSSPELNKQIENFSFIEEDIVAWCESCVNGVYMMMAQKVRDSVFNVPRKKIAEIDLVNSSLGLSMLDLLFSRTHSPNHIMNLINRYYKDNILNDSSINPCGIMHYGKSIPHYLKTLINNDEDIFEWYESEFKSELKDIAGIAIIDLRME